MKDLSYASPLLKILQGFLHYHKTSLPLKVNKAQASLIPPSPSFWLQSHGLLAIIFFASVIVILLNSPSQSGSP